METSTNNITPTIKEFLNDTYLFSLSNSKLIAIEEYPKEPNSFALIFEKTVFHAQGGGQPADEGEIELINLDEEIKKKFTIEGVTYDRDRDVILHKVAKNKFDAGLINREFNMSINEEKRRLFARLHSAGHLLDIAVGKLELKLVPGKGYHFPDSPYVEYIGTLDKATIPSIAEQIEKISNEVIESTTIEDASITKLFEYEEGKNTFKSIPNYLPENKPFRWVKLVGNDLGCPCGGTHVKHVKDIRGMKISKITSKGKIVRVSYNVI